MNPFRKQDKESFVDVEGEMTCEECGRVSNIGIYDQINKVLTWSCTCGHINKVDIEL